MGIRLTRADVMPDDCVAITELGLRCGRPGVDLVLIQLIRSESGFKLAPHTDPPLWSRISSLTLEGQATVHVRTSRFNVRPGDVWILDDTIHGSETDATHGHDVLEVPRTAIVFRYV